MYSLLQSHMWLVVLYQTSAIDWNQVNICHSYDQSFLYVDYAYNQVGVILCVKRFCFMSKSKSKLYYDWQSVGQSVLESGAYLGPMTNFSHSLFDYFFFWQFRVRWCGAPSLMRCWVSATAEVYIVAVTRWPAWYLLFSLRKKSTLSLMHCFHVLNEWESQNPPLPLHFPIFSSSHPPSCSVLIDVGSIGTNIH
jgi:hypothetical protein